MTELKTYKDYTGVATHQMVDLWRRYGSVERESIVSERAGMHSRDFRKVVVSGKSTITSLATADRIILAMGLNISALVNTGEITVIPVSGKNAPRRMAADEFWAIDIEPTPSELRDRAYELARLRDEILSQA